MVETTHWRKLKRLWADPTKNLPYGGAGLPKTKMIAGHKYYLHNWGPNKPRPVDLEWSKKQTGARYARTVRIPAVYNGWAIYVRP